MVGNLYKLTSASPDDTIYSEVEYYDVWGKALARIPIDEPFLILEIVAPGRIIKVLYKDVVGYLRYYQDALNP